MDRAGIPVVLSNVSVAFNGEVFGPPPCCIPGCPQPARWERLPDLTATAGWPTGRSVYCSEHVRMLVAQREEGE